MRSSTSESKFSLLMKAVKFIIFIALFIVVIWLYAFDIYTKFNNVSTTFVSKTVDAEDFNMPPLTICTGK